MRKELAGSRKSSLQASTVEKMELYPINRHIRERVDGRGEGYVRGRRRIRKLSRNRDIGVGVWAPGNSNIQHTASASRIRLHALSASI